MSRTVRKLGRDGSKAPGRDWWKARPLSGLHVSNNRGMRWWKRATAKAERRIREEGRDDG
jgi:hypothetical protein